MRTARASLGDLSRFRVEPAAADGAALVRRAIARALDRRVSGVCRTRKLRGQRMDRWKGEQIDDAQFGVEPLPQPVMKLNHQHRVAAEIEEIVVNPNRVEPKEISPDS